MPERTAEHRRLEEISDDIGSWRRWGPYLADRSWGTVREDYSTDGSAWNFLPFDAARSKAYRWGEDGIAGISDRFQLLCFAPAFWNSHDAILKERLFGLIPDEGNHGEDVKEVYFYLDNVPSHAYMKFLYKYPHHEFPYSQLIEENQRRAGQGFEYELLDTGVFEENRYFDLFVEYAKATEEDLVIRIEAINRGPEPATLHLLPQIWFRNTWAWGDTPGPEPLIWLEHNDSTGVQLVCDDSTVATMSEIPIHYRLGRRVLHGPPGGTPLFTNNETHAERLYGAGVKSRSPFVKDAIERHVIHREASVNPENRGTKAALHYTYRDVAPGESVVLRLSLSQWTEGPAAPLDVESVIHQRRCEADEFYASIHAPGSSADERHVQRSALAGLLWSKQSYIFDVNRWFEGDNTTAPPPESRTRIRNRHWRHLNSMRILTVPDKWEYPWFAAWDLAFHCVALAQVDPQSAKDQLWSLLFEQFLHPNGQIPAYEWEFSDLNPPVHAWAVWRVYNMERIRSGKADRSFLERCFHKMLINFAWWVNRVDKEGNNLFEGGFLGLDNITLFDRSNPCAEGTTLLQADATGWMGMYCLNLMRIALELAHENRSYEHMATKFFQHYAYIASAMKNMGGRKYALWDDTDGFFYDVLANSDGTYRPLRVRSFVGLIPLFAVERLEESWLEPFHNFRACLDWFLKNRGDLVSDVVHTRTAHGQTTHVLTIVDENQLRRILERVWDSSEFLSNHGIRSLSRAHIAHPFELDGMRVTYEPREAETKIKGGNSNWRGPIWLPTCFLLIESLRKLGKAYGKDYSIALPEFGDQEKSFSELAADLANRLIGLFTRNLEGNRPMYGGQTRFQSDPHWKDHLLFYEYFNGDDGSGLGASHQTGWTALVATLIDEWRKDQNTPRKEQ